jgi:uncharacterized protein YjbI with pentapeptide repeats
MGSGSVKKALVGVVAAVIVLGGAGLIGRLLAPTSIRERLEASHTCRLCDLSGADLRGADLTGIDLIGAVLTDADLSGAVLKDADLTNADVRYALFQGCR